jgi:cytoskeleton protein RodZ
VTQSTHTKKENSREDVSLGSLLRKSREERHIDLDEAFRVTRIRRHNLEALESEQWDKLPPQVFVKGFIKTYAEFLGLDKEMVLEYYERSSRLEKERPEVLQQVNPQAPRWHLKIFIPALVLAVLAGIVYLSKKDVSIVGNVSQYLGTQDINEEGEYAREKEGSIGKDEKYSEQLTIHDKELVDEEKITASKSKSIEEAITQGNEDVSNEAGEKPLPPQYILTANVKSRTWIAILVDDEPVKEYIFQPGEKFQWTADKGFDILVGNAGGIEFFLNGDPVGSLGAEGKVVRLRLPERGE